MIRNLMKSDIPMVMDLLERCKPYVQTHHEYSYWLLSQYYSKSCFVYTEGGKILGYLGALESIVKSTLFVWQICVDPEHRRKNIGIKLLKELESRLQNNTFKSIQLTITDGNSASFNLFKRFSEQSNLNFEKIDSIEISGVQDSVYIIEN